MVLLISWSVILFLGFGLGCFLNGEYGIGLSFGKILVAAIRPLKVAVDENSGCAVYYVFIKVIEFLFDLIVFSKLTLFITIIVFSSASYSINIWLLLLLIYKCGLNSFILTCLLAFLFCSHIIKYCPLVTLVEFFFLMKRLFLLSY